MKRKLFLAMLFLVVLACVFFSGEKTSADNEITATNKCLKDAVHGFDINPLVIAAEMPTIEQACNVCHETFGGALWINGYSGNTPDDIQMYSSTSEIIVPEGVSTYTLYLHGQIYACGINIDANNSGDYDAHYIYITKHDHRGATQNELEQDVVGYVKNQENLGGSDASVDRVLESITSSSTNRWTKPKKAQAIEIDLEKYKQTADLGPSHIEIINGRRYNFEQWEHTVYVYRCPVSTSTISSDGCWADESKINLTTVTDITPAPTTCPEQYTTMYTGTCSSWYNTPISYNECGGKSVLASRIGVNGSYNSPVNSLDNPNGSSTKYAKPGDTVNFNHCIFPGAQLAMNTEIKVGDTKQAVKSFNNFSGYSNRFEITSPLGDAHDGGAIGSVPGPNDWMHTYDHNYSVKRGTNSDTGKIITETNNGGNSNPGWTEIGNLTVDSATDVIKADSIGSVSVSAVIPYNFVNSAAVNWATADSGSLIYAGEKSTSINGRYITSAATNSAVNNSTYATRSPASKLRLYTYYSDNDDTNTTISGNTVVSDFNCANYRSGCTEANGYSSLNNINLNPSENVNGDTYNASSININVADINAGKWLCAVAAVYPAGSGAPTNYTDAEGTHTWSVSQSKCVQIAKKPSFELWNGNLYANGNIQTNTSTKYTVAGHNEIGSSNPRTFGSWVEHGLIVKGNNNKLASGAVLGYQTNSNTNLSNNPGGHSEGITPGVCKRSPLTIANQPCVTGGSTSGDSGIAVTETVNLSDYISVAQTTTSVQTGSNDVDLSSSNYYTEKNGIRYTYNSSSSKLHLKASSNLPSGVTHIIYSKGSVYIHGNLTYTNGPYSSPSNVPQYIIITDGSIFIDGAVTRVDSWLVADGKKNTNAGVIRTCVNSNGEPLGEQDCFKQLRINGPIIAKRMELDRVYGAATGNNSATSAEILNFAPSTYIFSQSKASENTSLRTVFSKEVAPRW